jgi:multidrug efflux pump subunit AcrA (membrane-fusion protein)
MKKRTLWIVSGLALAAVALVGWRLSVKRATPPASVPVATPVALELAPSDVLTVRSESLALGLPVSGTLKATQTALVKARVAGELMDLAVREGDTVQAGQVVARIDPTEYQSRWRQAQQQADAAKAQLDIAQKQYDNNEALVKQGFISQTALQTSLMSLGGARASHQSALAAGTPVGGCPRA